jgi:GNAT superfamily N-acetyltransferase
MTATLEQQTGKCGWCEDEDVPLRTTLKDGPVCADCLDAYFRTYCDGCHGFVNDHEADDHDRHDPDTVLTEHGEAYLATGRNLLYLQDVHVLAPHRGKGEGRRLMALVTDRADSLRRGIDLHVYADNTPALRLYKSVGFTIVETTSGVHRMVREAAE